MKAFKRAGCLFILTSIFGLMQSSYADPPLPTPVGRVVWVKGTFKATMPNNEERLLQKTSVIYLHDTLSTDSSSRAEIVFTDNTLLTFRPDSKFNIDQYSYTPKKKGSVGKYVMKLLEGGFRTITGLIAKTNPNDYQVNTPVATIGVRGSDYAVYFHLGEIFVAFYAGEPCVRNKKGEVCLSSTSPYAVVRGADVAPIAQTEQPSVFNVKDEIVAATIAPFTSSTTTPGGPITSFCITQ